MNQFILKTPQGERYATLMDLPLTRAGDPFAQRKEDYAIGDTVYLAWSGIEAKVQARMSQYRMTKGIVVEFQSGFRSIGVRFNGDPELIWLKRSEISRVPEVSG